MKNKNKTLIVQGKDLAISLTVDKDYNLVDGVVNLHRFTGFASSEIIATYPIDNIGTVVYQEPKLFKKGFIMITLNDGQTGPLIEFKDKDSSKNAKLISELLS